MEEKRIFSVQDWLQPLCVYDIQVFIKFANFYCQLIKSFSKIARLLMSMLKTTNIKLPDMGLFLIFKAMQAFEELKQAFIIIFIFFHFNIK